MTESSLKALMRLFALVAQVHSVGALPEIKLIVESFLKQFVRNDGAKQYLIMFEFYHNSLREREFKTGQKQLSLFSVKSIIICEEVNKELDKKQKISVLLSLIDILCIGKYNDSESLDFIKTISLALHFDEKLLKSCIAFAIGNFDSIPDQNDLLFADNGKRKFKSENKHIEKPYLRGYTVFLYLKSVDIYLFKHGETDDKLYYIGQEIILNRTYILQKGSAIKNPLIGSISYSDIVRAYYQNSRYANIYFSVEHASFTFGNSENGIKQFNFDEPSGQLIGIMGGSGVGKSTLLNLLNGNIKPQQGNVLINGYNVHHEKDAIKGIIGYIPQDDLLIEELSVYQNLYYSAKLCFDKQSEEQIRNKVHKVLYELDLFEIRHLKVGNPLNKFISGGQRKRLNIALELIREPYVLFVDEPTSGLSSTDSDIVIDLLKEQSLKGKLIIINIHQPSSDIYKTFDKLILMDKGGRMVYQGTPLDALVYLKSYNQLVNASDGECTSCGNINPEQALQILEAKKVNEYGEYLQERKVSSEAWYSSYKKNLEKEVNHTSKVKIDLPENEFQIPPRSKQFKIFGIRNLLSKLADKQYLLINLLEAPVLAFILAWVTKYKAGLPGNPNAYVFSENINLPVYIFMLPIVALFLGMMVAAEDIIRDRKIIQREQFLNLSIFSYFNSKIFFLAVLSALQAVMFVLVGNSLLHIKGMFFPYFLMFFATALFANVVSLNISATMKSVVSIYILIPLLLVPQILLGGAMIQFDKLNSKFTHKQYVPIIGDLMVSRWTYEALSVYQYINNNYKKHFYEIELTESKISYLMNYHLPELQNIITKVEYNIKSNSNRGETRELLQLLSNEMLKLEETMNYNSVDIKYLKPESYNMSMSKVINDYLNSTRQYYAKMLDNVIGQKDSLIVSLQAKQGGREELLNMIRKHHNLQLEDIVLNKSEKNKIQRYGNELIQKYEPIYLFPDNSYGRAQMFAPYKKLGNVYFETFWFNLLVIMLLISFFYLTLIFNLFPKLFVLQQHLARKRILWRMYRKSLKIFSSTYEVLKNQ